MKAEEIIREVDELRAGNHISNPTKLNWLKALEEKIGEEVLSNFEGVALSQKLTMESELFAPERYRKMYVSHIVSELDYVNGETELYNNDVQVFNEEWKSFCAWVYRTYRHKSSARFNAL